MQRALHIPSILETHQELFIERIQTNAVTGDRTPTNVFAYDSLGQLEAHGLLQRANGAVEPLLAQFGIQTRVQFMQNDLKIGAFVAEAMTFMLFVDKNAKTPMDIIGARSLEHAAILVYDLSMDEYHWSMASTGRDRDGKGPLELQPWENGTGFHPLMQPMVRCADAYNDPPSSVEYCKSHHVQVKDYDEYMKEKG